MMRKTTWEKFIGFVGGIIGGTYFLAAIPVAYLLYIQISLIVSDWKYGHALYYETMIPFSLTLSLIALSFVVLRYAVYIDEVDEQISKLEKSHKRELDTLDKKIKRLQFSYEVDKGRLKATIKSQKELLLSKTPFNKTATMVVDLETVFCDKIEDYLRNKSRPANRAADEVKKLKETLRGESTLCKEMFYKYEYLLSVFPELREYVEDEEGLLSLSEFGNYEEVSEGYDRVHDWVPKEEWNSLSENARNQLALDRYKASNKSAWVAGVEYEMYVSYLLRNSGYKTVEFGALNGLNDLGRDIIATKGGNTYIIQCKRYSSLQKDGQQKFVHENVICQLFGTTIEYQISHKDKGLFENPGKVFPVLYTTGHLSQTATEFAKRLNVKIEVSMMDNYPMIKCNINNGKKIYHLPFDQQYWRTKIEKEGEFYAWTVEEAHRKGFRRALRYYGR